MGAYHHTDDDPSHPHPHSRSVDPIDRTPVMYTRSKKHSHYSQCWDSPLAPRAAERSPCPTAQACPAAAGNQQQQQGGACWLLPERAAPVAATATAGAWAGLNEGKTPILWPRWVVWGRADAPSGLSESLRVVGPASYRITGPNRSNPDRANAHTLAPTFSLFSHPWQRAFCQGRHVGFTGVWRPPQS